MSLAVARRPPGRANLRVLGRLAPGVALCAIIACAAVQVGSVWRFAPVLLALVGGMSLSVLHTDERIAPGAAFTAKDLLRLGVALMGVRVSLGQVEALGWQAGAVALIGLAATLTAGFFIARALKLPRTLAFLTAGAVAICGASAALAIAAVLPPGRTRERETAVTVALVTVVGSGAMILYPLLGNALGLGPRELAIFLGGTLHEMAQVAGAGHAISDAVGADAVSIKLLRIVCLAPVVMGARVILADRQAPLGERPPLVPWFMIGFAVTALVANLGLLPAPALRAAEEASQWLVLAAVAALGLRISPATLAAAGPRTALAVVATSLFLAALVLGLLMLKV